MKGDKRCKIGMKQRTIAFLHKSKRHRKKCMSAVNVIMKQGIMMEVCKIGRRRMEKYIKCCGSEVQFSHSSTLLILRRMKGSGRNFTLDNDNNIPKLFLS